MKTVEYLLRTHQKFQGRLSLPKVLGDGYLQAHNPMFRRIRRACVRIGFGFSNHDFCQYGGTQMFALPLMIQKKTLFYNDNTTRLSHAQRSKNAVMKCKVNPKGIPIQINYLMHESSHCVADQIFRNKFGNHYLRDLRDPELKALLILMAEAYANTCEEIALIHAKTETHRIFNNQNSNRKADHTAIVRLQMAVKILGVRPVFALVYLFFLHSNFLYQTLSSREIARIAQLGCPEFEFRGAHKRAVESLGVYLTGLTDEFRAEVGNYYFSWMGFRGNFATNLDFDFLKYLETSEPVREAWAELTEIALTDP